MRDGVAAAEEPVDGIVRPTGAGAVQKTHSDGIVRRKGGRVVVCQLVGERAQGPRAQHLNASARERLGDGRGTINEPLRIDQSRTSHCLRVSRVKVDDYGRAERYPRKSHWPASQHFHPEGVEVLALRLYAHSTGAARIGESPVRHCGAGAEANGHEAEGQAAPSGGSIQASVLGVVAMGKTDQPNTSNA